MRTNTTKAADTSKTTASKPTARKTAAATSTAPPAVDIVATERAAAHRPKTVLHIGITEATASKIRRQAERRNIPAEDYVMESILERLAEDFTSAIAKDTSKPPVTMPTPAGPRPAATRAEREAFVRQVARMKGMDEEALIAAVILNDEDEDIDSLDTVTLKIPARISAACAEHGITPAAFVRAITEDALENLATARDLIRELFPLPPMTRGKVRSPSDRFSSLVPRGGNSRAGPCGLDCRLVGLSRRKRPRPRPRRNHHERGDVLPRN